MEGDATLYRSSPGIERGFCGKCGSALFYRDVGSQSDDNFLAMFYATLDDRFAQGIPLGLVIFAEDTRDAFPLRFLPSTVPRYLTSPDGPEWDPSTLPPMKNREVPDSVAVRCHCRGVDMRLRRRRQGDIESVADGCTVDIGRFTAHDPKRWRAAMCTCYSCRKASGRSVENSAFVPLSALSNSTSPSMHVYESSKGVRRSFCGRCGAVVFFQIEGRSALADLAVGLMEDSGVSLQWDDWVHFAEEDAANLVRYLEPGLEGLQQPL